MLPFAFAENERACLDLGWQPYHVWKGFGLDDSVVTCGSTMTWGNPVAIGTGDPAEAVQLLAWEVTEKQQNALGNTNPRVPRMVLVSEPAAAILAAGCPGKGDLERALIAAASRPLWMRRPLRRLGMLRRRLRLPRTRQQPLQGRLAVQSEFLRLLYSLLKTRDFPRHFSSFAKTI